MTNLLRKADHLIMRRACITQSKAPGGAHLPEELVTQMMMTQNIDNMLDVLARSPYWSWIDVRLLDTIVVASESPLALELLNNYKSAIFSRKLVDVLPHFPGKEMKKKQHTKVVSKVKKDPKEMTVDDLLNFQKQLEVDILDVADGTSILESLTKGCIEVHWCIPTECVEKAFHSATLNCYKFHDLQLHYLQIGSYHVIHDPLSTQDSASQIPTPPDTTGTCKQFIDHYYQYLSVNMDTEVALQLMISQQLIVDPIDVASSSNYQSNCLILEMLRRMSLQQLQGFCEVLQARKRPAGIDVVAIVEASKVLQVTPPSPDDQGHDDSEYCPGFLSQGKPLAIKPAAALQDFLDVKFQIAMLLLRDVNPRIILEQCSCLMASDQHNISLFAADVMETFQEETQTPMLIQKLSPYFTWADHSVLTEIVKACHNPTATEILTQYDTNLDSSQPLLDYTIANPVHQMLPKDNSTHTVLAVQLDLELQQLSLQDVFDTRNFILKKCEVTPHTLQLLSVAQGSSTILYWMISRCVVPLVTSKVSQNLTDLHQKGILHVAIYPSTILATGKALSVGPLSFLTCFDEMITSEGRGVLKTQLSQLEHLPKVVNQLHRQLLVAKTEANNMVSASDTQLVQHKDVTFQPDNLQDDQSTQKTDMSDTPMVQEMDDVENRSEQDQLSLVSMADMLKHVRSQKGHLVVKLKENETYKKFVEQQLDKEQQKYSTLLKQYEELKSSFGADDIQKEIHKLEGSVDDVRATIDKIELVKMQWTEMETLSVDGKLLEEMDSKKVVELSDSATSVTSPQTTKSTVSIVSQLKILNEKMNLTEKSSKLFTWLWDEMTKSKEKITLLESQLRQSETDLQQEKATHKKQVKSSEERSKLVMTQLHDELSEPQSRLTVRDLECTKLKEENKLMIKQLSGRRADQTQQEQMLGSGKYGEVTQVFFNTEWYASKTTHKKLLPGYPDVSADGVMEMIKQITTFLSTIKHPNVEQFVLVSQQSPTSSPTLISELLPYNLDSFIAQNKESLTVDIQLDLCHDMAEGLNYLLTAGILHTNLHGRNVLVSDEPKAVVADFICPKVLTAVDDTVTDQSYLAPEVIKSKQPPTELSVVFSLGVLCLQTVTGHPPSLSDGLELSETERRMADLQEVDETHPLLPTIQQCLSDSEGSRPSISEVPSQIKGNRNQLVMSNNESPPLVEALQTKQYHLKWDKCSDLPRSLYSASVVVHDNNVYVTAGDAPEDETYNNVYQYNITTDQWNTLPPSGHRFGVLCMVDSSLSIFGGTDPVTRKIHNKVSTYNRDTNSWTSYYPNMIQKRFKPGVVTHGDHLMVMGGRDQSHKSLDSIETMNWQHKSPWREVSTKLPVPMWAINPTIAGEHLLIVGYGTATGRNNGSHQLPVSTITSSSDQVASQWEELSYAPHHFTTTVPSSNPPLIIGGRDVKDVVTSDISLYDTSKKSWIQVDNLTTARIAVGVATINSNTIIVVGGTSGGVGVEAAKSSSLPIVEIGHIVHH
ncbi:uncharacterized protein [Dysidea avara]